MLLKDASTFEKLNGMNDYLLWQHNVPNLLDSCNLHTYIEKDYQQVIDSLARYNEEIFDSLASSVIEAALPPSTDPDLTVLTSRVPLGEKALLLQKKKFSKAKEQADAAQAEALLAKHALKKAPTSSSLLNRANTTSTTTKKANLLQTSFNRPTISKSPFKDNKDLTWFLSYACKIQSGSSQTHALISASLNMQLQNYINQEPKSPFRLWATFPQQGLEANLDHFDRAIKGVDEKVINFISHLETYQRLITTDNNKVGDNAFSKACPLSTTSPKAHSSPREHDTFSCQRDYPCTQAQHQHTHQLDQ